MRIHLAIILTWHLLPNLQIITGMTLFTEQNCSKHSKRDSIQWVLHSRLNVSTLTLCSKKTLAICGFRCGPRAQQGDLASSALVPIRPFSSKPTTLLSPGKLPPSTWNCCFVERKSSLEERKWRFNVNLHWFLSRRVGKSMSVVWMEKLILTGWWSRACV